MIVQWHVVEQQTPCSVCSNGQTGKVCVLETLGHSQEFWWKCISNYDTFSSFSLAQFRHSLQYESLECYVTRPQWVIVRATSMRTTKITISALISVLFYIWLIIVSHCLYKSGSFVIIIIVIIIMIILVQFIVMLLRRSPPEVVLHSIVQWYTLIMWKFLATLPPTSTFLPSSIKQVLLPIRYHLITLKRWRA